MLFRNLGSFIGELKNRKDLVVIEAEVDPYLEIPEIHRRVIAAGGPALYFNRVKRKRFPVVTNLFGTADRVNLAFGNRPKDFVKRVASLPHELLPPSLKKLWDQKDLALQGLKIGFKNIKQAPVLANRIPNANLSELPALTSWVKDGGPFLTLPLVHTKSITSTPDNLGMYRIQIHDAKETGMHFQIGKGGGFHLFEAEKKNLPLPTNIYLGGPPALILSAIAPLPENVPELMLASLLLGEKLGRSHTDESAIDPIAEAEFCLSGHVPPNVRRAEGPFGDHYGYYSWTHDYPVFRPQNIFYRSGAVFPATVVGKPRQEDFFLGDYLQELLLPMIPMVMPGVVDLWSYGETGYHSLSAAILKERYGRESMASVFRILGEGQVSLTKFLLGIDKRMDLRDFRSVLTHVLERVDWRKDLYIFGELSMDTLDYTGPEVNKGSKGVILGLGEPVRTLPHSFSGTLPTGLVKKAKAFAPGCLVVEVGNYKDHPEIVKEIPQQQCFKDWPLLIAVDDLDWAVGSDASFLWTTFTRFEPAQDIYAAKSQVIRHQISYEGPILIDARMKPSYPDELFCDENTRKIVDKRWTEYFPEGKVDMGSSDYGHLRT